MIKKIIHLIFLTTALMSCDSFESYHSKNDKKRTQNDNSSKEETETNYDAKKENSEEKDQGPFPKISLGMNNLHNTCFANSATSLFFEIQKIKELLYKKLVQKSMISSPDETEDEFESRENFQKQARKLFDQRNNTKNSNKPLSKAALDPYFDTLEKSMDLINGSDLVGGIGGAKLREDQGDSADFLNTLLLFLEFESPSLRKVYSLVNGKLKFNKKEDENIIPLVLENDKKYSSFHDIFKEKIIPISTDEKISIDDTTKVKAKSYRYIFQNAPDNLIFKVELFRQDEKDYTKTIKHKLNIDISHELNIDISDEHGKSKSKELYNLRAVSIHQGGSLNSGHYYTYVYDKETDRWIEYNDSLARVIPKKEIPDILKDIGENGYVYLYRKN